MQFSNFIGNSIKKELKFWEKSMVLVKEEISHGQFNLSYSSKDLLILEDIHNLSEQWMKMILTRMVMNLKTQTNIDLIHHFFLYIISGPFWYFFT